MRALYFLFGVSAAIALLHAAAIRFYLYWTLPWFDAVVHFLGGLFVAAAFLWLFALRFPLLPRGTAAALAALAAVAAGFGWEGFELAIGIPEAAYGLDTAVDLAMDLAGGLAGAAAFRRLAS